MYPSPIPAAAFTFPDLIAVFDTPAFTPLAVMALLLECVFFILGCAMLWSLTRPLSPRRSSARRRRRVEPAAATAALKFTSPLLRDRVLLPNQLRELRARLGLRDS